jgi:hypothetical protein
LQPSLEGKLEESINKMRERRNKNYNAILCDSK